MSIDRFRAIEDQSDRQNGTRHNPDDLLIATISSFCDMPRPGRNDLLQFADLTLPLLTKATVEAKKQAAMLLAHVKTAPHQLIFALAEEVAEISMPLLLHSPILTAGDLINLISSHGLDHARIIARRPTDDGLLQSLLASFADPSIDHALHMRNQIARSLLPADDADLKHSGETDLAQARAVLDAVMQRIEQDDANNLAIPALPSRLIAEQLLSKALNSDNDDDFDTAFANILGLSIERARLIKGTWPGSQLPVAFRALGLNVQECYLLMTAVLGTVHITRDSLREFIELYQTLSPQTALTILRRWRTGDMTERLREKLRDMVAVEEEQNIATTELPNIANNDSDIAYRKAL